MKKITIKSAIPVYGIAALWLLAGLLFPKALLRLWFLILMAALSVGAYFVLSKVFPGREVEVRDPANSGDKDVDAMIEAGRAQLDSIKAAADELKDTEIEKNLSRMKKAGENIFATLEKDVKKAGEVRKFMNYYLPTAEKLVSTYRSMQQTDGKGANIEHAMQSVRNSLGMIADAFEKQNDNLYRDKVLDIDTDIDVLETMMSGDGLLGKGGIGFSLDGFTEPNSIDVEPEPAKVKPQPVKEKPQPVDMVTDDGEIRLTLNPTPQVQRAQAEELEENQTAQAGR